MLGLLFGVLPLCAVLGLTWFVVANSQNFALRIPWIGALAGLGIALWIVFAPESVSGSWWEYLVPLFLVMIAALVGALRRPSIAHSMVETCAASAVVVAGLVIYSLADKGDGTGLDAVAFVLYWFAIYLPGTLVGTLLGGLASRRRA